ncbi:hypothetical protein L2E82_02301 [Cichorium intybus]|uniref:Uncharacterized protein n=1 Tax=Cichorium intybus TaxID=13427 RepID=A0ACB9H0X9_CICIN|nr:hypothetical protein L2E82_02301 [Cichorium intybus]
MCTTRSVCSWNIVVQRVGNKLFFDKRDGSQLDLLSVNDLGLFLIEDVAKGIDFLHFSCDPPIVHCDIKHSKVLLKYAKVVDFGLAIILGVDENEIIETFYECGEERDQETETAKDNNTDVDVEKGGNMNFAMSYPRRKKDKATSARCGGKEMKKLYHKKRAKQVVKEESIGS